MVDIRLYFWYNHIVSRYNLVRKLDEHFTLSTAEYQALAEFRHQVRKFLTFSERAARAVGLEPQQHQLLLTLRAAQARGKVTNGDLAERLKIQHNSTVELINRMVERGLVQRCRDEQDQRRALISLTARGEEGLRRLSLLHRAELRLAGPALVEALQTISGHYPAELVGKE